MIVSNSAAGVRFAVRKVVLETVIACGVDLLLAPAKVQAHTMFLNVDQ